MRVSKFIHSCVLIEKESDRILFDPGKFSFIEKLVSPNQFQGITAVILTHGHPDHLDPDALAEILKANPHATVFGNAETVRELAAKNIPVTLFESGERHIGSFEVLAISAEHAPIIGPPAPQNTAYLVDRTLLNPGDSFAPTLDPFIGTPVLLLPVMAPWAKELEVVAFAERMRPTHIMPIHDGQAKDFFLHQRYTAFRTDFTSHGITLAEPYKPGDGIDL